MTEGTEDEPGTVKEQQDGRIQMRWDPDGLEWGRNWREDGREESERKKGGCSKVSVRWFHPKAKSGLGR